MAVITATTRLANPRPKSRTPARRTSARRLTARRGPGGRFLLASKTSTKSRRRGKPATAGMRRKRRSNPAPIIYTLGAINPRPASRSGSRPKKGKKVYMAKKRSTRRRSTTARRRMTTTRRRVARRNPVAKVYRRRRTRRSNPVAAPRRRRRTVSVRRVSRRRRNPSVYGSRVGSVGSLKVIAAGLAGVAAVKIAGKFVPSNFRVGGGLGDALITGALAVGVGMLAGKFFGSAVGEAATFGGLMLAGSVALNSVAPNLRVMEVPLALSGYNGGMGAWVPASFPVPQNPVLPYMPPAPAANLSGMGSRALP